MSQYRQVTQSVFSRVFLLLGLCFAWQTMAAVITPQQSKTAVSNWLRKDARPMGAAFRGVVRDAQVFADAQGTPLFNCVNLENGGFVITSADDGIMPIVAFSGSGTFDADPRNPLWTLLNRDMPKRAARVQQGAGAALKMMAASTAPTMAADAPQQAWAKLLTAPGPALKMSSGGAAQETISDVRVAPLVQARWNQAEAGGQNVFNYYTPNNYVCGCVATATAQIMHYHRYPTASVTPVLERKCSVDRVLTPLSMLGGVYDWDNMPAEPDWDTTETEAEAIGKLTFDLGVAFYADYTDFETGAYSYFVGKELQATFGYASARYITRYNESAGVLPFVADAVLSNLDAGYPVEFGIQGSSGGHAIVGDGYGYQEGLLYVHLNMGWGGVEDMWYNLPTVEGRFSFSVVDDIVYNIFPDATGEIISGRVLTNGVPVAGATVIPRQAGAATDLPAVQTNDKGIYWFRVPSPNSGTVNYDIQVIAEEGAFTGLQTVGVTKSISTEMDYDEDEQILWYSFPVGSVGNRWGVDITLERTVELAEALGTTGLIWITGGSAPWFGQSVKTADGVSAAQSGEVPVGENSWLQTTVTGPGTLIFKWSLDSKVSGDKVDFTVDGSRKKVVSVTTPWTTITNTIGEGVHTLRWTFIRGVDSPPPSVAAWLDQVVWRSTLLVDVTFDYQDGITLPTRQSLQAGLAYGTLPAPKRTGYVFEGWYTDPTAGVQVTAASTVPTAALTLYARWSVEPVLILITFNPNSGKVSPTSKSFEVNVPFGELPVPTRAGYVFDGWFSAQSGGSEITADDLVPEVKTTLYAQWIKAYTLTVKNGAASESALFPEALADITADAAPANQEFQKWTLSPASVTFAAGFSATDASTRIVMPAANVTLTAVYIKAAGSLGVEWVSNIPGKTVDGVQWSTDKKTWYNADEIQRLTSGTYTLSLRSTNGQWLLPASVKVTLNAGPADSPTLASVACEYAPAFNPDTLAGLGGAEPTDASGTWDAAAQQMSWDGLYVGLRAKLGPLPLSDNAPAVKLASGKLPTGLALTVVDGAYYIAGIPSKAGVCAGVLQAINGKKNGERIAAAWNVADLPAEYVGTFNGVYTATTNDVTSHSALTLTVAKTGKLTGSVNLGGKKYTLKADAFDAVDHATGAMTLTNGALICTSPKLTHAVALTISLSGAGLGVFSVANALDGDADFFAGQAVRNGWSDKTVTAQKELRTNALAWTKGYYTLALAPEVDGSYGAGYVTLTVDAKGAVKAAGKLADGTSASGSGVLLVTDADVSTVIALAPSAYKGGEFYLNVRFIQDAGGTRIETVEDASWVNRVLTSTSDGPFERAPIVQGGWYSPLANLRAVYANAIDSVHLQADRIEQDVEVFFNAKGTGVDALPKGNAHSVKLTLTPKTGLFSGSFNETGVKTAYKLYGVLTPYLTDSDNTAGLGYYSIPVAGPPKTQVSELFRLLTEAPEPVEQP